MDTIRAHWRFVGALAVLMLVLTGATYIVAMRPFSPDTTSPRAIALKPKGVSAYTALDGTPVDLATYEGKTIVVYSWATWSPFSANDLRALDRLASTYADKNVVVLAMDRKETAATVRAYLAPLGTLQNIQFLLDPSDTLYKAIGGYAMPETVIYGPKGDIAARVHGSVPYAAMQSKLEAALQADHAS